VALVGRACFMLYGHHRATMQRSWWSSCFLNALVQGCKDDATTGIFLSVVVTRQQHYDQVLNWTGTHRNSVPVLFLKTGTAFRFIFWKFRTKFR